jgi:hypothetical protein
MAGGTNETSIEYTSLPVAYLLVWLEGLAGRDKEAEAGSCGGSGNRLE